MKLQIESGAQNNNPFGKDAKESSKRKAESSKKRKKTIIKED